MTTFLATATKDGALDWGSEANQFRLTETLKKTAGKTWRLALPEIKRTDRQHRYYFAYLEIISMETGHTVEELHQWAKRMFLPPKFITVMGNELRIPASTKDLTKLEMIDYIDRIAAQTNVPPPDPALLANYIAQ